METSSCYSTKNALALRQLGVKQQQRNSVEVYACIHVHSKIGAEPHIRKEAMSKELLLQEFAEGYEELIEKASLEVQPGATQKQGRWGPREIVGHLAGWEVMASVRIPRIVAGMPPAEFTDVTQQTMMNDAINAAMITLIGEQPLETLCSMLRQTYQRNVELLRSLDDSLFQPGEYVYERTKAVIEHCQEHMQQLVLPHP